MKRIIENLRNKSEETRRHILHGVSLIFAVLLFFLWVYSLGGNFNDDTQAKIQNDAKPLSAISGNLISGYESITGSE
jgi:hypothetical protein